MKCVIVSLDMDVIKTHNMTALLNFLSQYVEIPGDVSLCAELLNPFAVAIRYPYGPDVDETRTHAAIAEAQTVKEWVKSLVQFDGEESEGMEAHDTNSQQGQNANA